MLYALPSSGNLRRRASNPEIPISHLVDKMFSRFSYQMGLSMMYYALAGSGHSKRASSKPEIPKSMLVGKISTQFQRLHQRFEVQLSNGTISILYYLTGMAVEKLKVAIYQLMNKIRTKFQRL